MIREVAELYFIVPSMIQSLDIIKWLGKFRNNARYNNDTYFSQMTLLEKLLEKQEGYLEKGMLECPSKLAFEKLLQRREEKGGTPAYNSLTKRLGALFDIVSDQEEQTHSLLTAVHNVECAILPREMLLEDINLDEDIMRVKMKRLRFKWRDLDED